MSDSPLYEIITCSENNVRLDSYLSAVSGFSRTRIVQLIESELVLVNGLPKNKNHKLFNGDNIQFLVSTDEEIEALPQDIPLDIFFEDEHLIVVNKPQGMVVHPAPGNPDGTLVNALLFHCKNSLSGINGKLRPGIVHRIDKDTSGLLIVAKNDAAHNGLSQMFRDHSFERKYEAILYGAPSNNAGTVSLSIGRSKKDRKKMACYPPGTPNTKEALTHYRVLDNFGDYSHVECTLETGRTHQIRVHMLSLGCPVLGDPIYAPGRKNFGLTGQCLHAKHIGFHHPISGEFLSFDAPLPLHFSELLHLFQKKRGLNDELEV